ncbi:MAG: ATP-binding protein [Spirochaetota bacterium]
MKDVLIIEDESFAGNLLAPLKAAGFVAVEKNDPREAVHELEKNRYAVIIADVNRISELSDFWREKLVEAAHVPIVLTCDVSRIEDTLFPIKQNVYDLIVKPYDFDEVKRVVAAARDIYLKREQKKDIFPYLTASFSFDFPSRVKSVGLFSTYAADMFALHGLGRAGSGFSVACEEAMMNAHLHGNKSDEKNHIRANIAIDAVRVTVTIEDDGEGFQYASRAADERKAPDIYRGSGRGIALIEMYTDEYRYENGGRRIVLIKNRK